MVVVAARGHTVVLAQIPLTLCLAGSLPVCCLLLTLTLLVTSTQQSIQAQHCLLAGGREGLPGEPRVLGAGGGEVVEGREEQRECSRVLWA